MNAAGALLGPRPQVHHSIMAHCGACPQDANCQTASQMLCTMQAFRPKVQVRLQGCATKCSYVLETRSRHSARRGRSGIAWKAERAKKRTCMTGGLQSSLCLHSLVPATLSSLMLS